MLDQSALQKAVLWLSGFQDALSCGDAGEAAGQFAETWISFETATNRGKGHLRLPFAEWLAARSISPDVADRVGKCWGLGADTTKDPGPWEGELRNMWKPTAQTALWFHQGCSTLSDELY